ncbi:MAG: DUF6884 domain-containing protein [Nitrososphaerales archaeon]
MRKVILIFCSSKKLKRKTKARDLYTSPLFRLSLKYAMMLEHDNIFILSAKHGLLELGSIIAPYDLSLNKMPTSSVKIWADKVLATLKSKGYDLKRDRFVFLAGRNYTKFLIPCIENCTVPMSGLGIGMQLRFLKKMTA